MKYTPIVFGITFLLLMALSLLQNNVEPTDVTEGQVTSLEYPPEPPVAEMAIDIGTVAPNSNVQVKFGDSVLTKMPDKGAKVVDVPDAEGYWWYCVEHNNVVQFGMIDVGNMYDSKDTEDKLSLQVHDWDYTTPGTGKRWMSVKEWSEQHRRNGGDDGLIKCTPVVESNPFEEN